MAAIEKRQKEISDGLASAERAKKDLDLAQANATDQLKKAKAEAQVIIEQANKRRSQIWTKLKLKQNRNAPKSLHKRRLKLMLSVNVHARSCVSRSLSWLLLAPRRSSNVPWMKLLTATSWINLSLNCKEGGADV
jgi:F-type H+-transporting ATPase subunit b